MKTSTEIFIVCHARPLEPKKKIQKQKKRKNEKNEEINQEKGRKSEVESRFMLPSDSADIYSRYKMQIPNENLAAS